MSRIKPTWADSLRQACTPDAFTIKVLLRQDSGLFMALYHDEYATAEEIIENTNRVNKKLALVEEIAARLAANMLKGVLKYVASSDRQSIRGWLEDGFDDAVDAVNYLALALESMNKEKS